MYTIGLVVFSKSGRDKAQPFIVVGYEMINGCEYLYLVDGRLRKLEKPKKKKSKHVQVTKDVALDIQKKLQNHEAIIDAQIKKALLPYANARCSNKEAYDLVER